MERVDSVLDIVFEDNGVTSIYCRENKSEAIINKMKFSKHPEASSIDVTSIQKEWERNVRDPVEAVVDIVTRLRETSIFRGVKIISTISGCFGNYVEFDDRLLELLVNELAEEAVDAVLLKTCDFCFTNVELWYAFMELTRAKELRIENCSFNVQNMFAENDVLLGLGNVSRLILNDNIYSDGAESIGVHNLLRKDSIAHVKIGVNVNPSEILNKLKRYYEGDFRIEVLRVGYGSNEEIVQFLDSVAKRVGKTNPFSEEVKWEITTRNGLRRAEIKIVSSIVKSNLELCEIK